MPKVTTVAMVTMLKVSGVIIGRLSVDRFSQSLALDELCTEDVGSDLVPELTQVLIHLGREGLGSETA